MINKKRIGALLLAGAVVIGMGTTAFAKERTVPPTVGNGTASNPATVSITKDLEMAEGLAIPTVTFNFTAEKITEDAPNATITPISYSNTDSKGTTNDGKYIISKNSAINFGTFLHAGEYLYTITETKENAEGVTYSSDRYTLRVQVANGQQGLFVQSVTAEKGTDNGIAENKVDKILFTNTYRKNASLTISKNTTGELADKTKQFDFTIRFEKSATESTLDNFTGVLTKKDGKTETITCSNGAATFKLADGDKLEFTALPAGTKYTVTETGLKDGYTSSVKVTDNGTQGTVIKGNDENNLSSSEHGNYVGENENKVEFTNTYHTTPITGILMNNFPFILLIGIVILAFVTFALVKRCKISER